MAGTERDISAAEDSDLVNRALAKATGATIHRLGSLIMMYRWGLQREPDTACLCEIALRTFLCTGELKFPSVKI